MDEDDHWGATEGMRGEVRRSWFWEVIGPMLESGHPVREKAILLQLASASNAMDHKPQLETLIDWLAWVGIVRRDGEFVVLTSGAPAPDSSAPLDGGTDGTANVEASGLDPASDVLDQPNDVDAIIPRTPAAHVEDDAIISFNVSVRLTSKDVQNLNDEQMQFVMSLAEKLRG